MKTDIINPQINFEAVQTEFRKKGGPSAWLTLVDNQIWVHRFWDTMDQRRFSYILSTCLKTPAPRIQA